MLGEGFDHPNLNVTVIFCSFRSMSRFSQFVGRAVRRLPNNGGQVNPHEQVRGNPIKIMSCIVRRHIVILMTSDEINIRVMSWFGFSM
jgi:superfamily II DNA or RNA helicase